VIKLSTNETGLEIDESLRPLTLIFVVLNFSKLH